VFSVFKHSAYGAESEAGLTIFESRGRRPPDRQLCASLVEQSGPMSESYVGTKQASGLNRGFTLVELMITVAVVAILAAIAIPSYRQFIIRGNRSAGESVMMDIANREQQFLLANRSYANTATLTANGYTLPSNTSQNYSWNVVAGVDPLSNSAPIFTITFTPINGQSSDVTLTLDNQGTKTPIASWSH